MSDTPEKDRPTQEMRDRLGMELKPVWNAYREAHQFFRDEVPGWQAHFTDHHKWALGAALVAYAEAGRCARDQEITEQGGVLVDRNLIERLERAQRGVVAGAIASSHLLQTPFTNKPELSPWDLFKRDLNELKAAVKAVKEAGGE